jgi:GT2 family glycosyltransferase
VTYNRKALLRECLAALEVQARPVDEILVVDNASTDGTLAMLATEFPHCQTLALTTNSGGAGGFHAGMHAAYEQGFDWLWLMDDDGRPAPDCLQRLLARQEPNAVLVPLQQASGGRHYGIGVWRGIDVNVTDEIVAQQRPVRGNYIFAFVGPLISRSIVAQVGLPNKDFFIWYDDSEYALRIMAMPNAQIVVVPDAIFFHDFGGTSREVRFLGRTSLRSHQPAWKAYYSARNPLYIITRTRRNLRDFLVYSRYQLRYLAGDIAYEPDRWKRARLRLAGFRDGALGRLGKRM